MRTQRRICSGRRDVFKSILIIAGVNHKGTLCNHSVFLFLKIFVDKIDCIKYNCIKHNKQPNKGGINYGNDI